MKKKSLIILFLLQASILFSYAQLQNEYITTYRCHKTKKPIERLKFDKIKSKTIENDSLIIISKVDNWTEIDYNYWNRKTGKTIKIRGNTEGSFTLRETDNNPFLVIKTYYGNSGRIHLSQQYYQNNFKKDPWSSPVCVEYNFDEKGNLNDSIDYEKEYTITFPDVLCYLKQQSSIFTEYIQNTDSVLIYRCNEFGVFLNRETSLYNGEPYEEMDRVYKQSFYYSSKKFYWIITSSKPNKFGYASFLFDSKTGLLQAFKYRRNLHDDDPISPRDVSFLPPLPAIKHVSVYPVSLKRNSIAKERFYLKKFHTGTNTNDNVKSTCVIKKIKTIWYKKESKKTHERITISGNTIKGFTVASKDEEKLFDGTGMLKEYNKYGVNHILIYSCQYDSQGNIIKEEHYKKE